MLLDLNSAHVTNPFCLLKGQNWNIGVPTKQSKPSLAKTSSKLFFVNRLRGKKFKTGGSSKVLQDTSNTLDVSQISEQGPQKVHTVTTHQNHSFFSSYTSLFPYHLASHSWRAGRRGLLWPLESFPKQPYGRPALLHTGQRQQAVAKWQPREASKSWHVRSADRGITRIRRKPARPQTSSKWQPCRPQPPDVQRWAWRQLLWHVGQVPGNRGCKFQGDWDLTLCFRDLTPESYSQPPEDSSLLLDLWKRKKTTKQVILKHVQSLILRCSIFFFSSPPAIYKYKVIF